MINILLVDDQRLIRACIKRMLKGIKGIAVVGEAENGEEGVKLALKLSPHIVLMDLAMPGINGLDATQQLLSKDPDIKVLVVTGNEDDFSPTLLLQAGASGYITKNTGLEGLIHAIYAVHRGQRYISSDLAHDLVIKQLKGISSSPFNVLSGREQQIADMISQGIQVKAISEHLAISPKTVNSYRYRLFEKLNVENNVQLTHLATQYKFHASF